MEFTLHFDGGSRGNPGVAGYGAVLSDSEGKIIDTTRGNIGHSTNNVAEYQGLIHGLGMALSHGVKRVQVKGDSNLVLKQVAGKWKVNAIHLAPLCKEAKALLKKFEKVDLQHVPRNLNKLADAEANLAMDDLTSSQ